MGQGQVKPVEAEVEAISDFPVPSGKRQLMNFLHMAGYYRKFCHCRALNKPTWQKGQIYLD